MVFEVLRVVGDMDCLRLLGDFWRFKLELMGLSLVFWSWVLSLWVGKVGEMELGGVGRGWECVIVIGLFLVVIIVKLFWYEEMVWGILWVVVVMVVMFIGWGDGCVLKLFGER